MVVRRVACERGGGILNRLAGDGGPVAAGRRDDKSEFYTFREERAEEDEFVDASEAVDESKELEALKAVTDQAGEVYSGQGRGGWSGGPRPGVAGAPHFPKPPPKQAAFRPDADPELRMQQQQQQQNKTKKGLPRTFLADAPARVDGDALPDSEDNAGVSDLASTLLPNAQAFQSLIARSGGQSQSGTTNNLSYALKLTSTQLPEHLTCGICSSLVSNPMLVPWDDQGRPACESCIRDGLLQNGYKCPMTGIEGVSPEDLFPNVGLRKAAEAFEKSVWEKMATMEEQIEAERKAEEEREKAMLDQKAQEEEFEDTGEGIVKGRVKKEKKKRQVDDFGEDEFGGDVFDVVEDENEEEQEVEDPVLEKQLKKQQPQADPNGVESSTNDNHNKLESKDAVGDGTEETMEVKSEDNATNNDNDVSNSSTNNNDKEADASAAATATRKREAPKRRGPPAGYVLGPAGAGIATTPLFGVNLPPPPPPPRPQPVAPSENNAAAASNNDVASNSGSRSNSIDHGAPIGNDMPGSPPPMMGRGRGDRGGRFPGRFNDYSRGDGGVQGRGRYNQQGGGGRGGYQDFGRGGHGSFQGRGGFDRSGPPQNQNWVSY